MAVSKGLKCPVVALPGVGHMPAEGEMEAARVFMWRRPEQRSVQPPCCGWPGLY